MDAINAGISRLVDASANRAREGLRVLEDIARFICDDAELTERLKAARHGLRTELKALPLRSIDLIESRDTPGDVGTTISTRSELDRGDGARDVVAAAAKRSQEALRSLEEHAKALGQSGAGFEAARYALYDIERELTLQLAPPCPQWAVCVLVTRSLCVHHSAEEIVARSAEGGAGCVQLREKELDGCELLDHAGSIAEACRSAGIHMMMNDRPDIARLVGADGVHLGQSDLPVSAARSIVGTGRWIGVSCSIIGHAQQALRDGADTCGLGPMFESTTKVKPSLVGPKLVRQFVDHHDLAGMSHLAISGITPENVGTVADAGGRGVAVSSVVCGAEDPAAICRQLVAGLERPAAATILP